MTSTTRGRCGWEDTDESTRPHEHPACKSSGPCLTKLHTSKPQCQTTTRHKIGTQRRRRCPHTTQPSSLPLNLHRVWKLSCPSMPITAPRSRRAMLSSAEIETRYAELKTHHEELGIFLALAEFSDPPLEYLAGRAATSNGRLGTVTQAGLTGGEERMARANPDPFVFSENEKRIVSYKTFQTTHVVATISCLFLCPVLSLSPKPSLSLLRARCKRSFLCLALSL